VAAEVGDELAGVTQPHLMDDGTNLEGRFPKELAGRMHPGRTQFFPERPAGDPGERA